MALFAVGCVNEDISDCPTGLDINFKYTLNNKEEDLFDSMVKDMRLYVFNSDNLLCNVIHGNGVGLKNNFKGLTIPAGTYTFVAWGGSDDDMLTSFKEVEMTDASRHEYVGVRVGYTTLENFRMKLASLPLSDEVDGEIVPQAGDFVHLFHGMIENLAVTGKSQQVTMEVIKNTNVLDIRVTGLQNLTPASHATNIPVELWVTGKNGRYNFDNTIGEYARVLRYDPLHKELDGNTLSVEIKLLRLKMARHLAEPVFLNIVNALTGAELLPPINLVEHLLTIKDVNGSLLYNTQADLDREDRYPIDIHIGKNLGITVTINNWVVIEPIPELGR